MQGKRFGLLAIGLLIMSETSSANASKKLLLETSQGQVEIAFLPELAPNHVNRIAELASSGFYDGIIFHRVIPGFMAQTGDPTGSGMGLAPIWMPNSPSMNTVSALLAWPGRPIQTAAIANFLSVLMDVVI